MHTVYLQRLLAVALATTTACGMGAGHAWSAIPTVGPDGSRDWWAIECRYHASDCFILAARVCPGGYTTQNSVATESLETRGVATRWGNTAIARSDTTAYSGRSMFIHCGTAELDRDAAQVRARAASASTPSMVRAIPELGATKPEAKALCEHQRGTWVDQGAKVGCRLQRENLFACEVADSSTINACTHWKVGADVQSERDAMVANMGKPTSVGTSAAGFRSFTWERPGSTILLTGYPAGVAVTETKTTEPSAVPDASPPNIERVLPEP
jgi:hypothetical protein